ncbi:hypothetical protein SAMN05216483_4650 [Streptomyces sp. 2131.1]|uniref:hypothetical protein n=1 Tax=Streptomyces sp. 2131.1 TaxID=1855346 RepID=UPI00089CAD89|nr:hypothetical protein [Streptomyces sp. 2131.1]SED83346.1 hypothetical protein SAMN05216483_4650 [Streptomyces sp. 2131.1]
MLKSSRRTLLRTAVATAALTVALSVPLPASASDEPARTWASEPTPYTDANLVDVVDMGRGRTWAAGFTVRREGKVTRFQPVVTERSAPGAAWTPVPSATTAAGDVSSRVNAVDANGARDVWLVGDDSAVLDGRVYTQHFDGTRWQVVPAELPDKAPFGSLLDVDARPGGAWAAGNAQIEVSRTWNEAKGSWNIQYRNAGIVRHFDGEAWRDVSLPELPSDYWYLNTVRAVSDHDVWASGYDNGSPLLMHYDGSSWQRVDAPGITDIPGHATKLAVTEGGAVWLVGEDWSPEDGSTRALVARHDATGWHKLAVPDVPARLFGVTARSGGGIAVVGQTLGERRDALAWAWKPEGGGRWSDLRLPQPTATGPAENMATGVDVGRAGITVTGTSTVEGAEPQPFVSARPRG